MAPAQAQEVVAHGLRQEALVGSRTTLDTLDSEQELLDARVQLVQAQRNEMVAAFSVLSATGQLSARQLGLKNVDHVAYIRFASIYKDFSEASDFAEIAEEVGEEPAKPTAPSSDKLL